MILLSNNTDYGFYATCVASASLTDVEVQWSVASTFLIEVEGVTPEVARDVLDSRFGRHVADQMTFGFTFSEVVTRKGWSRDLATCIAQCKANY